MKLKRAGLSQKYKDVLAVMYKNLNELKIEQNNDQNASLNTQDFIFNLICEIM